MSFASYPLRRAHGHPLEPMSRTEWPATLVPVAQLLDEGIDFDPVTVFVGENGSGKSTLVEAIAQAYGLSAEGGSSGAMHSTRASESELWKHLQLSRNVGGSKRGYFLRAETMHGFYTYLEQNPARGPSHDSTSCPHGESFLELVVDKFRGPGLWVLDEPESALSFSGCLALIGILKDLVAQGDSQVILSTHSPVLAAFPDAAIHEVVAWGLRRSEWSDLDLVRNLTLFLDAPGRFLRHL